ncbi:MAG: hypothetical protein ACJASM_001046 [Salibacteraceae bacterium]|jgi:hypothetical protein
MNSSEKKYVRTKAYRAFDSPGVCNRFIEGCSIVLSTVGVDQVTSSTLEWKNNTAASFVIICESPYVSKVYGGFCVPALEGTKNLPIVGAKVEVEALVPEQIRKISKKGAFELCVVQDTELLAEDDLDETIVIPKLRYTLNLVQVE